MSHCYRGFEGFGADDLLNLRNCVFCPVRNVRSAAPAGVEEEQEDLARQHTAHRTSDSVF